MSTFNFGMYCIGRFFFIFFKKFCQSVLVRHGQCLVMASAAVKPSQ